MRFFVALSLLAAACDAALPPRIQLARRHANEFLATRRSQPAKPARSIEKRTTPIAPKLVIVNMFSFEANVWYGIPEFDVLAQNISVPGMSPVYPDVHCTANGEICQFTTGESEINAAGTVSAVAMSSEFNFTKSYFMISGIAGVNPKVATGASVGVARFAIQNALQYEFDIRDLNSSFSTGYIPLGAQVPAPAMFPNNIYGTEVFELNENLRDRAFYLASLATLNDTETSMKYRAMYPSAPANEPPKVVKADTLCSDVYFSGTILSEAFENYTALITNGSGIYGFTAQEDNASLSSLMRAAVAGMVDFSRIILMRSASDFDRPPPNVTAYDNLFTVSQGFFPPSLINLYLTGREIIGDVMTMWTEVYEPGIKPGNYIGDIFGTLGGPITPDFGPYPYFGVG